MIGVAPNGDLDVNEGAKKSMRVDMSDFELIESLFVRLIFLLAAVFSESEIFEVREFVDAGEYGLALDTVVDVFVQEKKIATTKIVSLIRDLAAAMELAPEDYVSQLIEG